MRRAALGAAAVLAVLLGPCALIDVAAPTDRIVNAGRIWKCELLGGTRGVDLHERMGVRDGYLLNDLGYVRHRGVNLVTAEVKDARSRRVVGRGVWSEDANGPPERLGAMNADARKFSTVHSSLTTDGRRLAVRAARECGRRDLPR